MDQLLVYCRALGPNPTWTHPIWTATCVAYHHGREVGHWVTIVGQNVSARDMAFQVVMDAAGLARDVLAGSPSASVSLFSADHLVLPYCQVTDRHNNVKACSTTCDTISDMLSTHLTSNLYNMLDTRHCLIRTT